MKTPVPCHHVSCVSISNEQLQATERWPAVKCPKRLAFLRDGNCRPDVCGSPTKDKK